MKPFYIIPFVLAIAAYLALSEASVQCVDSFENEKRCCKTIQMGNDTENFYCWPKLLVIGTMKSGTTLASLYMTSHPQITHARPKEVHYFGNGKSNPKNNDEYLQVWPASVPGERAVNVEATPRYLYSIEALQEIKEAAPSTRLLVFLRNPADRAWSEFNMMLDIEKASEKSREWFEDHVMPLTACFKAAINSGVKFATDKCLDAFPNERLDWNHLLSVREALRGDAVGIQRCLSLKKSFDKCGLSWRWENPKFEIDKKSQWIFQSNYIKYMKRLFQLFPKNQVLVLFYEDLISKPVQTMQKLFKHAGVDPFEVRALTKEETKSEMTRVFPTFQRNSGWRTGKKPKMSASDRNKINAIFRGPNTQLQQLIGKLPPRWPVY